MTATRPDARLAAHLEVAALRRAAEAAGGFATVLRKGEAEAGTIMVVTREKIAPAQVLERMPQPDGTRNWHVTRTQDIDNPGEFEDYLKRRAAQDSDLWIIELDNADGKRLVASLYLAG